MCVRVRLYPYHTIHKHTWESVWLWVSCAYLPKDRLWCVCKDLGTYKDRQNIKINTWFQDTLPSHWSQLYMVFIYAHHPFFYHFICQMWSFCFVILFSKEKSSKKSNSILEWTVYLYISCAFAFWMNAYRFYIHFHFHSFPFWLDFRSILLWTCGICVQHNAYNYEHWLNQTDDMARLSWNERKCKILLDVIGKGLIWIWIWFCIRRAMETKIILLCISHQSFAPWHAPSCGFPKTTHMAWHGMYFQMIFDSMIFE